MRRSAAARRIGAEGGIIIARHSTSAETAPDGRAPSPAPPSSPSYGRAPAAAPRRAAQRPDEQIALFARQSTARSAAERYSRSPADRRRSREVLAGAGHTPLASKSSNMTPLPWSSTTAALRHARHNGARTPSTSTKRPSGGFSRSATSVRLRLKIAAPASAATASALPQTAGGSQRRRERGRWGRRSPRRHGTPRRRHEEPVREPSTRVSSCLWLESVGISRLLE